MQRSRFLGGATAIALGLTLFGLTEARAGYTVQLESITPEGGNFRYSYSASITDQDEIANGDFFAIFDFNGYVSGSIMADEPDFVGTVQNTGPINPPDVVLSDPDNPNVENLVFTYTGGAPIPGAIVLFGFSALSIYDQTTQDQFDGRNTKIVDGTPVDSVGFVDVPMVTAVPEPASFVLAGLAGGAGLLFMRRRKVQTV